MTDYADWDPNPHVGGVQLRALMSFMRNHLRWNNAATTVENIEREDALWVRGPPSVEKLLTTRNHVMKDQAFVTLLETTQLKVVQECRNWIPFHRLEVFIRIQRRINALSPDLRRKYPFSV